ncbi:MAG: hypothetical protein UW99_C0045G0004 [Candidatus Collierbacteria bacterium GW2011_GWC2_45_15]|uniref:Uncharacterized protein n=2 Tax=Candidatus Collieribacteriota TaxID=1752725 RepID=A0A0G1IX64_9BACT|nr:MAG: hypothetical protein UW23_C0001G0002 [Candidatus Collierbacteria bacterium GW2011_GWA1_44_12]KKT96940.1 MAG: hypothetical protein UW99_C0045G0004 [Candidatus Collierbacteria bacterium GW2011_GWC2_45_15]
MSSSGGSLGDGLVLADREIDVGGISEAVVCPGVDVRGGREFCARGILDC